ncbi:hypothetical protein [Niveibacterium terrae]|uniref:hypothetical protein n=1 Tax=Niveibacterium terrae TaxID=3373598 RepID=UPI003A8D2B82
MNSIRNHLPTRIFWLGFMTLMGGLSLSEAIDAHSPGKALAGIGLILLGILNFMEPLLLSTPINRLFSGSRQTAVGSRRVRLALSVLGLTALAAGLLLRLVD